MNIRQTYLMVERLNIIVDCIASGFYPSRTVLMNKVLNCLGTKISIPTFYRDICFLRERMGVDIKWDSIRRGYYL